MESMRPTVDTYRALARSSPWRWTKLHFRHRSDYPGAAEAWVRRPGELLVRRPGGEPEYVSEAPYSISRVMIRATPGGVVAVDPRVDAEPEPVFRPDGLVESRPDGWHFEHGDPMWGNYSWTAMLDPVELSHHVEVTHLRAVEV